MPSLSDHVRRDAQHAARQEIRTQVMRYVRRMDELAKAEIMERLETATQTGEAVDGLELGRSAAASAIGSYLGVAEPRRALDVGTASEAETDPALD